MALYQVRCLENQYPGMWQRWYRFQCVGIGWPPADGYRLSGASPGGRGWSRARNTMAAVNVGDRLIVCLQGNRVGRIGTVTAKAINDDQWSPLVPASKDLRTGEMGRRMLVRWDLDIGPDSRDMVVELPPSSRLSSGEILVTIAEVRSQTEDKIVAAMNDPTNWVGLLTHFKYESALSGYIAAYPHRLEDGLLPHPNQKIREKVFRDKKRADVLLTDRNDRSVIVECKQGSPTITNLTQLRQYMTQFQQETGELPRGILVHGGSRKLSSEVAAAALAEPKVEIVQYSLDVNFSNCI